MTTPLQTKHDVLSLLFQNRVRIRALGVKRLGLFGSFARGGQAVESDVDLLVEFEHSVGLFEFIGLQQYLESLLGCRVDLGTPRSLKPHVKDRVLREAILVT